MARPMVINFPQADQTYLYALSVAGGAAGLVPLAIPYPVVFAHISRPITLTSTDNLSGVNFTIVGFDQYGAAISEVLAGPNNSTVTSVNSYNIISSITANGAYTNFSAGTGSTGFIQWIPMNYQIDPIYYTIQVSVTGTINYSLFQTLDQLGKYVYVGGTVQYLLPVTSAYLAANPIATTNTSGVVVVTVPSTAGLVNDQLVTINGATTTHTITAAELNITAPITILSATTFSFNSNGTANATGTGGGTVVTYTTPPYPTQFAITAALTGATTSEIYSTNDPLVMIGGSIASSSGGGALTLTILQAGV